MQEWYLLKPPHVTVSGFESEAFDNFASEGFAEALDSSVASDVTIYNYDLSESFNTRAVILDNVQDTRLKTMNRLMLVPIGTCHTSQLVKYKNRFWLIVGLTDDNSIYQKAVLIICNYCLTWASNGRVIQRWCNVSSGSQYNNGETSINHLTVTYDQLLILLPDDDESIMLRQGKRFIIDKKCDIYEKQFSDETKIKTDCPVNVFELTRSDSVLYSYQTEGCHEIMVSKTEKGKDDGYYVVDDQGYWLCENPFIIPESGSEGISEAYFSELIYDTLEIQNGLEPAVFTAIFYDYKGDVCTDQINYTWEINCDFKDQLDIQYVNNAIMISADDYHLSNKTFTLSLVAPYYTTQTVTVKIIPF